MFFDDFLFWQIHFLVGRSSFLDSFGIFLASYLPYLLFLGFIIFILKQKKFSSKVFIFLFAGLTAILSRGLITEIFHFFYYRLRPFTVLDFRPLIFASGNSFPSGHASFFFALAAILFYFNKNLGGWFFVLTLVNGFARIFVGVHWPSDIFAGLIIGLISFFVIKFLISGSKISQSVTNKSEIELNS